MYFYKTVIALHKKIHMKFFHICISLENERGRTINSSAPILTMNV